MPSLSTPSLFNRRRLLASAAATLSAAALSPAALALGPQFDFGRPDVVDFWRTHAPDTTLGVSAAEILPGAIAPKLRHFVTPDAKAKMSAAQYERLKRRIELCATVITGSTPLADVHGCSLTTFVNVIESADEYRDIEVDLTIALWSIVPGDPGTKQTKAGRWYTSGGEYVGLEIELNPRRSMMRIPYRALGGEGSVLQTAYGANPALVVMDEMWTSAQQWDGLQKRLVGDTSWYTTRSGPAALQVRGPDAEDFHRQKTQMTDMTSRLLAAMALTDWSALRAKMLAIT